MKFNKVLLVRKMSSLEFYYRGKHSSKEILDSHEVHSKKIKLIEKILNKNNIEYKTVTREELSERLISEFDLIISAGGDGTVIAVAAYNKDKPQLNLKTDEKSIGFLCLSNIESVLKNIFENKYKIEEWTRADVFVDGKFVGRFSNEVVIGESLKICKLSKYELAFLDKNELKKEKQDNSGLIITTGTGSTAWPAAFKPFPKESSILKFRAIMPHIGKIESGESDYFKIKYLGHTGMFALDTIECNLLRDSILEIKVSKNPLKVVIA